MNNQIEIKGKHYQNVQLPPWITIEDDVHFGGLYSPVVANGLASRPCTRQEILRALCVIDRAELKKELKKGFHPVLLIDLESGLAAIEMRQHVPSSTYPALTRKQKAAKVASADCHKKYIAFRDALLREDKALHASNSSVAVRKLKKGKK